MVFMTEKTLPVVAVCTVCGREFVWINPGLAFYRRQHEQRIRKCGGKIIMVSAQGMEARRGETPVGGSIREADDSPVPKGDAPKPSGA